MDNFYNYVNKEWLINNPIPNNKSKWSQFDKLSENNYIKLKNMIEMLDTNNNLKILYTQSLNKNKYNNNSLSLICSYLNDIENQKDIQSLWNFMIDISSYLSINLPLDFSVNLDNNNSEYNILYISTNGLSLPNKDYYSKNFDNIKNEYLKFINDYSKLFNININSDKILFLEEILAHKTFTSSQERDVYLTNNIRNINEINNDFPNLSFISFFFSYIKKTPDIIYINNIKFLKELNGLCINKYLNAWKDYFKFKLILSVNKFINDEIEYVYFNFYNLKLLGQTEQEPLWYRSINIVDSFLGQELGIIYSNNFFKTNNYIIDDVNKMFISIKNVIKKSLENNTWLSDKTKSKAIIKLNNINIKIGYPNKCGLFDYSYLKLLLSNDYLINIMITYKYNYKLEFNKLYKIKNKHKWFMHPHNINAYYSPKYNEIVIPAGILQEPFYYINDNEINIAKNYGGIGIIIGHEIIHAFDDKGRLYDEKGNLNNWWVSEDIIKYNEKVESLKNQFKNYEFMGYKFNMNLTIGEIIADLGGVKFALEGLKTYFNKNMFKYFFLNFAFMWASNIKLERLKYNILIDPHLPSILRVNGIIKNIDEFYETFNDMELNILSKNDRITIW